MSNLVAYKVPSLSEVYEDDLEKAFKHEQFNLLLSKPPKDTWIKTNKYANNSKYLPIDKVEYLLKKLFQQVKIEILREGTSFNGVFVVVRVHYVHPVTRQWEFHDGIGAESLQVKSGSSPAELQNINTGALAIAYPKAKSAAIKDACHHFGKLFGADLNRIDALSFDPDTKLITEMQRQEQEHEELTELYSLKKDSIHDLLLKQDIERVLTNREHKSYKKIREKLKDI